MMNQFFSNDLGFSESKYEKDRAECKWIISADDIFSSKFQGFEKYAELYHIEYFIYRSFLYDQPEIAESSILAKEVHISMPSGIHSAMLEMRLAKAQKIKEIVIKKVGLINNKNTVFEDKKFGNCTINTFGLKDEMIEFSFIYTSIHDTYSKLFPQGSKSGSAAAKIDLVKWEISAT